MKVIISDVVVVPREVELSEACDSCGADLRAERAIKMVEMRDECAYGRLPAGAHETPDGGVVIFKDRIQRGAADDGTGWIELRCLACNRVVVAGRRVIVGNAAARLIAVRIVSE